jgi:hypothetical protein
VPLRGSLENSPVGATLLSALTGLLMLLTRLLARLLVALLLPALARPLILLPGLVVLLPALVLLLVRVVHLYLTPGTSLPHGDKCSHQWSFRESNDIVMRSPKPSWRGS